MQDGQIISALLAAKKTSRRTDPIEKGERQHVDCHDGSNSQVDLLHRPDTAILA